MQGRAMESSVAAGVAGVGRYCRGCGYDLRRSEGRCPECGRGFDASKRRSYLRGPRAFGRRRWVKRVVITLLATLVPVAAVWGTWRWVVRGYEEEQQQLAMMTTRGGNALPLSSSVRFWGTVKVEPKYALIRWLLPQRYKRVTDRATELSVHDTLPDLTAQDVEAVSSLDHLRQLELNAFRGPLPAGTMRRLSDLSELRVLVIQGDGIADDDLAYVTRLKELRSLYLSGKGPTGAGLHHVGQMTGLSGLAIHGAVVDDRGVAALASLESLRELWLGDVNVTEAGLQHLKGMTRLEVLRLEGGRLTGEGLRHLNKAVQLKHLELTKTGITDAALAHLLNFPALETVDLRETAVTGSGFARLKEMRSLRRLYLTRTPVDDEGLKGLSALPNLETLDLSGTKVTDAGVERFAAFPSLKELRVDKTQITISGSKRLRELLPKVRVMGREGSWSSERPGE